MGRLGANSLASGAVALCVFAYYSGLMMGDSKVDKARTWWIVIMKLLVFALASLAPAALHGAFVSKTDDMAALQRK